MLLSYCITYKAISSPLVAAVASAAAVVAPAAAKVTVAGAAVVAEASIAVTLSDLMRFRLRYFIFLNYIFTIA